MDARPCLPHSSVLLAARAAMASVAQDEYDRWTVVDGDLEGFEAEFGGGGICHLIAERMSRVIGDHGVECHVVEHGLETHTYCLAVCSDGIFEVDVPYRLYEVGAAYGWTRIEGVMFRPDDVAVALLDRDLSNAGMYLPEPEDGGFAP